MAYAPVSWAYKDVIASSKLAQMVENHRTHVFDGHAAVMGLVTSTTDSPAIAAVETEIGATLRLPVTLKANRRYLAIGGLGAQTDTNGSSGELRLRNSGSAAVPTSASPLLGVFPFYLPLLGGPGRVGATVFGWLDGPAAGSHHLSLFGVRLAGGGNLTFTEGNAPVMFLALLDCGSTTAGAA